MVGDDVILYGESVTRLVCELWQSQVHSLHFQGPLDPEQSVWVVGLSVEPSQLGARHSHSLCTFIQRFLHTLYTSNHSINHQYYGEHYYDYHQWYQAKKHWYL